jgi:hypothetical protein
MSRRSVTAARRSMKPNGKPVENWKPLSWWMPRCLKQTSMVSSSTARPGMTGK